MKRTVLLLTVAALVVAGLSACSGEGQGYHKTPDWDLSGVTDDPDNPGTPDDPDDTTGTGTVTPVEKPTKPFYIWIDASANFPDFANSKDNIRRDLQLAKDVGFTDVVVDVRPTTGDILFTSSVGTPVEWLGAWVTGG